MKKFLVLMLSIAFILVGCDVDSQDSFKSNFEEKIRILEEQKELKEKTINEYINSTPAHEYELLDIITEVSGGEYTYKSYIFVVRGKDGMVNKIEYKGNFKDISFSSSDRDTDYISFRFIEEDTYAETYRVSKGMYFINVYYK